MSRGRPGTRQQRNEVVEFADLPPDAQMLLRMDGYAPVKWVTREELEDQYPRKPEIRDIGLMLGEAWSKRQDWAGPSMKFEDEKDYRFGKS